jgi:hypothetical protein
MFALQLVVFSALRLELEDRNSPHHGRYFFWFATPAVLLGVGVLGERLGAVSVAGLLLILGGSWLSTGGGSVPA